MAAEPTLEAQNTVHGDSKAETHASTEHASGGLPQFEFQHWVGQAGYLLFLFVITYVLIAKVFAPRMRRVIDERAETIDGAIATARSVQAEAEAQAEAARAEVDKARVTEEFNARLAADEAVVGARIAQAEAKIAATRDAAMGNVSTIASDATSAILERLTGKAPTAAELQAAIKGAA